jgi:hypothetical protein
MAPVDSVTGRLERILAAKEARRKELAALPYAEKVRIVVQLQAMAAPILRARGRNVEPWDLPPATPEPTGLVGPAQPGYPSSRR